MKTISKKKLIGMTVLTFILAMMFSMTAFANPAKVTGLRQTGDSTSSVNVEWKTVLGKNIKYQVMISEDNRTWIEFEEGTAYNEDWINNLSTGATYYVKVRAWEYDWQTADVATDANASPWSSTLAVVTRPDYIPDDSVKQTAATNTTISLKWSAAKGATRYRVYEYVGGKDVLCATVSGTTATVTGLKADGYYNFRVIPERHTSAYTANDPYGEMNYGAKTLPYPPADLEVAHAWNSKGTNEVELKWTDGKNTDGYELWVEYWTGSKWRKAGKTRSTTSWYYYVKTTKSNNYYRVKMRGYVNLDCGRRAGAYGKYFYFSNQPKVTDIDEVTGGVEVTWKPVKGATSYDIYASFKSSKGYKKVGTVKGNKSSFKFSKIGRKRVQNGKTCYIYVTANKKVGKKTYRGIADKSYYLYYYFR